MQASPLSCWSCGTILSAHGGRCPTCGAEQPEGPALGTPRTTSLGPRPPLAPKPTRLRKALPILVLVAGLSAIGAVAVMLSPEANEAATTASRSAAQSLPAPPPASAKPDELGVLDRTAVAPSDIIGNATARALSWNAEAVLVSIRAEAVTAPKLDLREGSRLLFEFGIPTPKTLGEAVQVAERRLVMQLGADGTEIEERLASQPARAALEPTCPFDKAVQMARAGGVPEAQTLTVSYAMFEGRDRAVWKVQADAQSDRILDGRTCAILMR